MSGGYVCEHGPWLVTAKLSELRDAPFVVTKRRCNRSAFNGYHETPSKYSEVLCLTCGATWRTRAAYANPLRDGTYDDWQRRATQPSDAERSQTP